MSCPACNLDYKEITEQIKEGNLGVVDNLIESLKASQGAESGAVIIFCPSCRETLARLQDRVASRLRKQTLGNIHNMLDEAYERRNPGKQG